MVRFLPRPEKANNANECNISLVKPSTRKKLMQTRKRLKKVGEKFASLAFARKSQTQGGGVGFARGIRIREAKPKLEQRGSLGFALGIL